MELTNKMINTFLALCASAAIGAGSMWLYYKDDKEFHDKYKLISECEEILEKNAVKLPDDADTSISALNGYLSAYGDKYTFYSLDEAELRYVENLNYSSCLQSCGYKVTLSKDGNILVTEVLPDSVAEKYGLQVGDVITGIDGEILSEKGIIPTALNLSGLHGTKMRLDIIRGGAKGVLEIVRENDYSKSVEPVVMEVADKTLYLRIIDLEKMTPGLVRGQLGELEEDYSSLIIDLRDNTGGIAESAVEVADMFIGAADVVFYKNNGVVEKISTVDDDDDIRKPIVLLCNENTASAAEILTALLKQYSEDVTIVGSKTFGKGVFQKEEKLSNGGVLRYTEGYYTVGDWECYQDKGIEPDVELQMDRLLIGTDKDIQLEKAKSLLG